MRVKTIIAEPLMITLKHLFKKPVTVQYPEERLNPAERFRGFLAYRPDVCTACTSCERNCPNKCIKIKTRKEGKKRFVEEYLYFAGRCMFCGICVEVCPTKPKAVYMTKKYELADTSKEALVFDFMKISGGEK
jgi:NADH-quinone oxidoreductase chain I